MEQFFSPVPVELVPDIPEQVVPGNPEQIVPPQTTGVISTVWSLNDKKSKIMAAKKVDIMNIRQLLLLKARGESNRSCEKLLGIHRNTINHYVRMFGCPGLTYEDLLRQDDKSLNELFVERASVDNTDRYKVLSGYFSYFEKELTKPGCTRQTLWQEYLQKHPDGFGHSQFNEHFARWRDKVNSSGKLLHKAGDKVYFDYSGKKLHLTDRQTGELTDVEVFVGILPASHYTYVEASKSQKKEDFIASVNRCLLYFGGVPRSLVTDNLKSAVSKPAYRNSRRCAAYQILRLWRLRTGS
jgi:hypothetical protein